MKQMSLKKLFALTLSGVLLLSAAGCSKSGASPSAPPSALPTATPGESQSTASDVKIGILIPGSPTDGGFSQQAAEAGARLEEQFGYQVSVVEAATAETIRSEGETMAAEGYKIVFGHGGQCSSPLAEISGDYPDTWFVTTGGTEVRDNQFPASLCLEESTYVCGVIAGMMTKSNVIAYSLGGDFPAYSKTTNAYELGAKSVNPDIQVLGAVLSSPDANEAYETTLNQIKMGADFIYSNTNEGQAGAMKAVKESDGVYAFGSLGNFIPLAPGKVIGNAMGDWAKAFVGATQAIMNNEITKTEIMFLNVANDSVYFDWNADVKDTLPKKVVDAAEQTFQDIKDGKIDVPNEYELG